MTINKIKSFKKEIEMMVSGIPKDAQTLLFSATMPAWIRQISKQYLKNPEVFNLVGDRQTPDKVSHEFIQVSSPAQRIASIATLLRQEEEAKMIIFVDTKLECSELASHPLIAGKQTR